MSLNKKFRISLKIRLAFIYTLLFVISGSLIFAVAANHIYREINRMGDEELCRIAENVCEWYTNALENDRQTSPELSSRDSYPENEKAVLSKRFPGMELISARFQDGLPGGNGKPGKNYYTATIWYKNNFYECRVRGDGSVYSKVIKTRPELLRLRQRLNQPPVSPRQYALTVLQRRFRMLERSHGRNDFFVVLKDNHSKKILLRAGTNFKELSKAMDFDGMPLSGFEVMKFRCIYSDIPGLGRLIAGRSIENRDTLIRFCLMVFVAVLISVSGVGVAVAWLIARRFILGIKQTTMAMQSIKGGDYSYRFVEIPYNDKEIVTLMENFNAMNERTENLLKEIKMMSDNVAHDLRTPLTRISGTVELLLHDRELSPEVRDVCVSVLEETLRLKALVNTIMDISRTNAHPDSLKKECVDIVELVRRFCDFMSPAFEERSLQLKLELPAEPLLLEADKTMFQRMLANLVENALKFTEKGGVDIVLELQAGAAVLSVRDSGCGILPQDIPHIFDRFYRADASRHLAGNGLGLSLVKAVVNAHKWKLEVQSEINAGTVFKIIIPLMKTESK